MVGTIALPAVADFSSETKADKTAKMIIEICRRIMPNAGHSG